MFQESEAFNLNTTQSVQKSIFVPYIEVFLIESRSQSKQIRHLIQIFS